MKLNSRHSSESSVKKLQAGWMEETARPNQFSRRIKDDSQLDRFERICRVKQVKSVEVEWTNENLTIILLVTEVTSIGSCVSSHEDLDYGPNTPDAK